MFECIKIDRKHNLAKWFYIIFIFVLLAIIVGTLSYNLKSRIKNSYCVVSFVESSNTKEINPGDTVEMDYCIDNLEFTKLTFFLMKESPLELHLKLVNVTTGEIYYDDDIKDNQYFINDNKVGVCLPVCDTAIPSKPFSKGIYHFSITNNSNNGIVSLSVLEDGNINVDIMNTTYVGYRIAFVVAILLFIYAGFMYISLRHNMITIEKFFLLSVIPLSIIYLIIFLPWNVPDVSVHFVTAYRWSNLMMGKDAWVGRADDVVFFNLFWKDNPKLESYVNVLSNMHLFVKDATLIPWIEDGSGMEYYYRMEYYSVFCYLPQSIGICVARILGLSTVWMIYFGRISMLCTYICACYNAIKKTPVGKFVFATIPLLPISLMMSSAISYDPLVIIASLNLIACVLRLSITEDSKKILIESCIWAALVGAIKGGGYIVLLPIVGILIRKGGIKQNIKKIGLVVCSGIISIVLFDVVFPAGKTFFQFGGDEEFFSARYAIEHPIGYVNMLVETFFQKINFVANTMGGSYLSWIEYTIPTVIIFGLFVVIGIYSVYEQDAIKLSNTDKYLFLFVIGLDLLLTPVMLLSWTPIQTNYIEGLQGRYFLPILPLLYLVLTKYNLHVNFEKNNTKQLYIIQKKCMMIFTVLSCICVFYMLRLYLTR